jgi:hypothetical protein
LGHGEPLRLWFIGSGDSCGMPEGAQAKPGLRCH